MFNQVDYDFLSFSLVPGLCNLKSISMARLELHPVEFRLTKASQLPQMPLTQLAVREHEQSWGAEWRFEAEAGPCPAKCVCSQGKPNRTSLCLPEQRKSGALGGHSALSSQGSSSLPGPSLRKSTVYNISEEDSWSRISFVHLDVSCGSTYVDKRSLDNSQPSGAANLVHWGRRPKNKLQFDLVILAHRFETSLSVCQ